MRKSWRIATILLAAASFTSITVAAQASSRPQNHQFCLSAGRHLCMAASHGTVNSAMVLRVDANNAALDITFLHGALFVNGHPGICVGADTHLVTAKTAHCTGGHGIIWTRHTIRNRGVEFINRAATNADPHHRPHVLLVTAQTRGNILAIGTNTRLLHVWRDCAGHCTVPAHAVSHQASKRRIFDCTIAKIQMLKVWRALDRFAPKWHREAYASAHCSVTHPPRTWNSSLGIQKVVFDKKKGKKVWRTMFSSSPVRVIPHPNKFYRLYAPCVPGTYRSYIDVWGYSHTHVWHGHHKIYSKPLGIVDCFTPPPHNQG
jgi:hypothetical protein